MTSPIVAVTRIIMAIGVATAALSGACAPAPEGSKVDNWAELCAKMDCEQFPLGRKTIRMGGADYYFPFNVPMQVDAPASGYFVDRDDDGGVLREAQLEAARLIIQPCCDKVFDALEIEESGFLGSQLHASPTLRYGPQGMVEVLSRNSSASLESWSGDFFLLEAGQPIPLTAQLPSNAAMAARTSEYVPLKLLSKRPLFFDRRVYLDCGMTCEAALLDPDGATTAPLEIYVMGINGLAPGDCEKTPEGCLSRTEYIAGIPRKLNALEQLFERLRIRPLSPEGM